VEKESGVSTVAIDVKLEPPIPLTAPDGRVFGYACARCLHVKHPIEGGTFEDRLRYSLEDAESCCSCRDCGVPLKRRWQCDICAAKERERWSQHLEETRPAREATEAHLDAALGLAKDRNAALLLQSLMSDISEDYYCAGWLIGLEQILWGMVAGGCRDFGMGVVTEDEVAQLKQLSEQAGGWWHSVEDDGETFITIGEWKEKYAKLQ
jgi:hypothetical protein